MLPTVSARTAIARHEITDSASRRRTLRALASDNQIDTQRETLRPHLSKSVRKAIPALSSEFLGWLLPDCLFLKIISGRALLVLIGRDFIAVDDGLQSKFGT